MSASSTAGRIRARRRWRAAFPSFAASPAFCTNAAGPPMTSPTRCSAPRRKRYEDLEVTTVSSEDVRRLLDACADWQEFLCVSTAVYLGARRAALARVRRGDVDLVR